MSILKKNIDRFPYTGVRKVSGQLKLSTKEWLNPYFDGTPDYTQIKGVTRGKIYDVISVEGYGDAEDVTFIDDNNEEHTLADFFFEEIE